MVPIAHLKSVLMSILHTLIVPHRAEIYTARANNLLLSTIMKPCAGVGVKKVRAHAKKMCRHVQVRVTWGIMYMSWRGGGPADPSDI